jgi:RNA polymerase sigma-70 factor (ECF subfamily)
VDIKASEKLKLQLLILRTQSGSETGFKELFNLFKNLTFKYLSSLINEADIDDIQQQVWFKVYQQISNLSSPFGFKRWLIQITHRTALDHIKKKKKYVASDDIESAINDVVLESNNTIKITNNFEQLHIALNHLSFDHKEIILLFYWQEFTCVEIAQILGCTVGTVKSRLFNARQKLKHIKTTSY